MPVDNARRDPFVVAVAERLTTEFAGRVAKEEVQTTVRYARYDLEGQIVPEALAEMLHRLAHYRLSRSTPSRR